MFDIRRIREKVIERSKSLRQLDEEVIHTLYAKAIQEELEVARNTARKLRDDVLAPRCSHPDQGWIMLEKKQVVEAVKALSDFVASF